MPLMSVHVAGLCRCLCCCRLPVGGPLSVLYLDMRRFWRRRRTGKHTDDSREQRRGNKRRARLDARQSRASCACGGWWLVAGGRTWGCGAGCTPVDRSQQPLGVRSRPLEIRALIPLAMSLSDRQGGHTRRLGAVSRCQPNRLN